MLAPGLCAGLSSALVLCLLATVADAVAPVDAGSSVGVPLLDSVSQDVCWAAQTQAVNSLADLVETAGRTGNYSGDWLYPALTGDVHQVLETCVGGAVESLRSLNILSVDETAPLANALLNAYQHQTGIRASLFTKPFVDLVLELLYSTKNNLSIYDGWIQDPVALTDIASKGGLAPLDAFVTRSPEAIRNWADIIPFFRNAASVWGGQIYTVPMSGFLQYLYFRMDLLEQYNLTVPDTWEELADLAERINGTDFSGDGVPDYALCLPPFLLNFMMASYLHVDGAQIGMLLDPDTMEPIVKNEASLKAMSLYRRLTAVSSNPKPLDQQMDVLQFYTGKCFFAMHSAKVFKFSAFSSVKGQIGIAELPGTAEVLDRLTGKLQPCTPDICPDTVVRESGIQSINRAPISSGFGGGINPNIPPVVQKAIFDLWTFCTSKGDGENLLVYNPMSELGPVRKSQINATAWMKWVESGYNKSDVDRFINITQKIISNVNIGQDFCGPRASSHSNALSNAARMLADSTDSVQTIADQLYTVMSAIVGPRSGPAFLEQQQQYWAALDYTPTYRPPLSGGNGVGGSFPNATAPPSGNSSFNLTALAVGLSVGGVVVLLALGALAWFTLRRTREHRCLLGGIIPPSAGPDTSLVVTDIQDSTVLWELLDSDVMDTAVKVHHAVVRSVLNKHCGYESATEGDSFIMAFFNAKDAVYFSVGLQEELLLCSAWPEELLKVPLCAPIYGPATKQVHRRKLGSIVHSLQQASEGGPRISRWCPSWYSAIAGDHTPAAPVDMLDILGTSVPQGSFTRSLKGAIPSKGLPMELYRGSPQVSLALMPVIQSADSEVVSSESLSSHGTVQDYMLRSANKSVGAQLGAAPAALLLRGLRVRVGINTGVENEAVVFNKESGRTQYVGEALSLAKAVGDAAQGGVVLISSRTHVKMPVNQICSNLAILHMGEHVIQSGCTPEALYAVVTLGLVQRLTLCGDVRSIKLKSNGFLMAPHGNVTIAFMTPVGCSTLMAWNSAVTAASISLYQQFCKEELHKWGGYLVEATNDGLCLVAFEQGAAAIRWALNTVRYNMELEWPELLLEHELGEEISINVPSVKEPSFCALKRPTTSRQAHLGPRLARPSAPFSVTQRRASSMTDRSTPPTPAVLLTSTGPASEIRLLNGLQDSMPRQSSNGQLSNLAIGRIEMEKRCLFRGLRLRCGLDMGDTICSVHAASGRVAYRGRVMNRSARVAYMARSGQVWCTQSLWEQAQPVINDALAGDGAGVIPEGDRETVGALLLGPCNLKGIIAPVNLVHCQFEELQQV